VLVSASVPPPLTTTDPTGAPPVAFEITPVIVCVVPVGGEKVGSPLMLMLLPTVKLPALENDSVVPAAIDRLPDPSALLLPMTSVPDVSAVPPV
jgi:hypothetical protein